MNLKIVLLFILISNHAWAGADALIGYQHRPRVADVVSELNPWPKESPFGKPPWADRKNGVEMQKKAILEILPRAIAGLERFYPGGTWAVLGRDAAFFGDMLDTFYSFIGQKNRVVRLNGSSASIRGVERKKLVRFLQASGLNLGPTEATAKQPPFVIIDNTNYNDASQSRHLLHAAYEEHRSRGGDTADLDGKLNVVRFVVGNSSSVSDTSTKPDRFFEAQKSEIRNFGIPTTALAINNASKQEAFVTIYTTEHHAPFGELKRFADGRYEGEITGANSRETRKKVLSELYTMISWVASPDFLERVRKACRDQGFEFKFESIKNEPQTVVVERPKKPVEIDPRKAFEAFTQVVSLERQSLGRVGEQEKGQLSDNGQKLTNIFAQQLSQLNDGDSEIPTDAVILFCITETAQAYAQDSIGKRDYRRILARLISLSKINDKFIRALEKTMEAENSIRKTLIKEKDFFLDKSRNDSPNGIEKYRELMMGLGGDCKKALKP